MISLKKDVSKMIYFYDWLKRRKKLIKHKIIMGRQNLRMRNARKELWNPLAESLEADVIKNKHEKLKKLHVEHIYE